MAMQSRWGDLPIIPDTESGIAAVEREQITKPRPVEVEETPLHQPSSKPTATSALKELPAEFCSIDSVMLHTIKLVQHAKKVRNLLHSLQQSADNVKVEDSHQVAPAPPPVPEFPGDMPKMIPKMGEVEIKKEGNLGIAGKWKSPPELPFHTVQQILRKSVAAICAHIGFDATTESVLETLTDIAHEHNLRVCRLLRYAVDREALTGSAGFVDVMEQVFHQIGIGSISNLQKFYHSQLIGYHQHMLRMCQQYMAEYERLRCPDNKEEAKPTRVKEEPILEIHFPVAEDSEGDEKHGSPLHLEELHGALQNEGETSSTLKDEDGMKWPPGQGVKKEPNSTPNLDPDEEIINVSDSPAPSNSEIDMVQSIPSVSVSDTLSPTMDPVKVGKPPKKKKKK